MNTKKMAFDFTNGLMNVFNAAMMSPETEETQDGKDRVKKQMINMLSEAAINFQDVIKEVLNEKKIITPNNIITKS